MVLIRYGIFWREIEGRDICLRFFDRVLCVLHRAIPESLCWHVLEGVTNALLWLHYGYSNSRQKKDWSPIALINIHPGSSMLSLPLSLSPSDFFPKDEEKEEEKMWRKHDIY